MNVLSLLLLSASLFVWGTANAQNVHGVLRVVKGDVQIKSSKGETAKARIGGKVFPKDVVITGKDARAKIVMVDNNEINLSPDSQVEIQHYEFDPNAGKKDVLLNVIYGKVRSKVEQKYDGKTSKFQIKTPSAVAGVRGTDFMMGFNSASRTSQVVTFEGKVEFGVPGPGGSISGAVMVTPGQVANHNPGQSTPSAPAPMPKEELAKVNSDSSAEAPKVGAPGSAPAAEGDQRTPANEGKEKAPATEDKKSDGGGAPRGPASVGPGPGGESACTMCGAPAETPPPPPIIGSGPVGAPLILPTQNPALTNNGTDQFIRDTIKGGQTNLIIRVNGQ